jgi:hypothetical protein
MRRTEIAGFGPQSQKTLQPMARKTAPSAHKINKFAVVQAELIGLQLKKRPRLSPCCRHSSAVGKRAYCSLIIPAVCASVKRLFLM